MSLKDDLDDYKLDTTFQSDPKCVIHKFYKVDRARGFRKVEVLERWFPHGKVLGAGAFGTVRLEKRALSDDHEGALRDLRAVKQLYKWQLHRLKVDFRKELSALIKFSRTKFRQYEVFVEFWNWYENEESIFLAMEYFPLGTLGAFIEKKINENDTRSIATQLLEGLRIMHSQGFTHRDLKPENIFVVQISPQWAIKIGDFGISKRVLNNNTIMQTATGSPNYLAPEVYGYVPGADAESSAYTNAVDIWSFGCVIYEIFAINVPFPSYPQDIMKFCRGGPFPEEPLVARASKEGIDFVKSALQPHPLHRLAASQMLDATWLQIQDSEYPGQPPSIGRIGSPIPAPGSTESIAALETEESEDIENENEEGGQTITCLEKIVMPPLENFAAFSDTLNSPAIFENTNIDESKTTDISASTSILPMMNTIDRRSSIYENEIEDITSNVLNSRAGPPSPAIVCLPEDPPDSVTIPTMNVDKGQALNSKKSPTSLLIEYFEGTETGKSESKRPSVQVRVTPSSKSRNRSSANDHLHITERKDTRKPSYTKRIQLPPNIERDELPSDQEGEGSKAVDSPQSQPNVLETPKVSSHQDEPILPSNMVENASVNVSTIREPIDDQDRGNAIPLQHVPRLRELLVPSIPLTTAALQKQQRELWSEEKKERRRREIEDRGRNKATSEGYSHETQKHEPQSPNLTTSVERLTILPESPTSPIGEGQRLSNPEYPQDIAANLPPTPIGNLFSSMSESKIGGRYVRPGTSSINNPKLIETVEDAIKCLILPELSALKKEDQHRKREQRRETGYSSFEFITNLSSDSTQRKSQSRERTPTLAAGFSRRRSRSRERSIISPTLSEAGSRDPPCVSAAEPLPSLSRRRRRSREERPVKQEPIPERSYRFDESSDEESARLRSRPRFRNRFSNGNDGEVPSTQFTISRKRSRSRERERGPVAAGQPSPSATRRRSLSREYTTSKISLPYPSFSKAHSKDAISASPTLPKRRSRSRERKPVVPPLLSRSRSQSRERTLNTINIRSLSDRLRQLDPIQKISPAYDTRDPPIHQQIQDAYEDGYSSVSERKRNSIHLPLVPATISKRQDRSRSRERVSIVPSTFSRRRSRSRERWPEIKEAGNRRRRPSLIPGVGLHSGAVISSVDCNKPLPPHYLDAKDVISKQKVAKKKVVAKERSRSRSSQRQRRIVEGVLSGAGVASLPASQKSRPISDPRSGSTSYPRRRNTRPQYHSELTDDIPQSQNDFDSGTSQPPGLQTNRVGRVGSSVAARKVMDFFRRRGKSRAGEKYEIDGYEDY